MVTKRCHDHAKMCRDTVEQGRGYPPIIRQPEESPDHHHATDPRTLRMLIDALAMRVAELENLPADEPAEDA